MVRHLSRKRHWTTLISERQREKFASMAHRSPSSQKLIQDHWVWEDQGDATTAILEREVVDAVKRAVQAHGRDKRPSSSATRDDALALAFDHDAGDTGVEQQVETECQAHKLSTLLSTGSLDILRRELAHDSTCIVFIPKSLEACQAQMAIDRLKTYKQGNEVHKELPKVQNAPGTRAARLKREEAEREALLSKEEEASKGV